MKHMKTVLVQTWGTLKEDCSIPESGSTTLIAGSAVFSRSPVRSQCETTGLVLVNLHSSSESAFASAKPSLWQCLCRKSSPWILVCFFCLVSFISIHFPSPSFFGCIFLPKPCITLLVLSVTRLYHLSFVFDQILLKKSHFVPPIPRSLVQCLLTCVDLCCWAWTLLLKMACPRLGESSQAPLLLRQTSSVP